MKDEIKEIDNPLARYVLHINYSINTEDIHSFAGTSKVYKSAEVTIRMDSEDFSHINRDAALAHRIRRCAKNNVAVQDTFQKLLELIELVDTAQ